MPTAATVSIYTQPPVSTTYKALAPDRTYNLSKPQFPYLLKNEKYREQQPPHHLPS